MASLGVIKIQDHFKKKKKFRHGCKWRNTEHTMKRFFDYIYTTDWKHWKGLRRVKPRKFSTDHIVLMGKLVVSPQKQHTKYVRRRMVPPFPVKRPVTDQDNRFEFLAGEYKGKTRGNRGIPFMDTKNPGF